MKTDFGMISQGRITALTLVLWFGAAASPYFTARADDPDYGGRLLGGSSYVQHGPGPAYDAAYSNYAGNATGIYGRFSDSYGEYKAKPGYGRFGSGSAWGSGSFRAAGTGRGARNGRREGGVKRSKESTQPVAKGSASDHSASPPKPRGPTGAGARTP